MLHISAGDWCDWWPAHYSPSPRIIVTSSPHLSLTSYASDASKRVSAISSRKEWNGGSDHWPLTNISIVLNMHDLDTTCVHLSLCKWMLYDISIQDPVSAMLTGSEGRGLSFIISLSVLIMINTDLRNSPLASFITPQLAVTYNLIKSYHGRILTS